MHLNTHICILLISLSLERCCTDVWICWVVLTGKLLFYHAQNVKIRCYVLKDEGMHQIFVYALFTCIYYVCVCLYIHLCTEYRCVLVPVVSEVRQSNVLAGRLAGRERAKWRHIGAGIVLLRYSTGWLMRKFSHRGLSIKHNNCKGWKRKKKKNGSNHNLCKKKKSEWPVLNQTGQLHPLGCGSK